MAKILIIDRDIMEALLEEAALEQHGHDVRVEPGDSEGLALIGTGWPDLIILDPRHDAGVAAVHAARAATDARAQIPLLLVSNPHQSGDDEGAELADLHLKQPVTGAALRTAAEGLLGPRDA